MTCVRNLQQVQIRWHHAGRCAKVASEAETAEGSIRQKRRPDCTPRCCTARKPRTWIDPEGCVRCVTSGHHRTRHLVRQVFRTSTDRGRSIRGGSINEAMLLEHATMSSSDCHVAGLVHEPESLPFIDDCTKVFRCVKQLLHTSLWTRGVDWQEASN